MMHLVYLLDFHLFGLQEWGFHLVNALLHAANTALLFLVAGLLVQTGLGRRPARRRLLTAPTNGARQAGDSAIPRQATKLGIWASN